MLRRHRGGTALRLWRGRLACVYGWRRHQAAEGAHRGLRRCGISAILDDFHRLELYRSGKRSVAKQEQDKGHRTETARFIASVSSSVEPSALEIYFASPRAILALAESLRTGKLVQVL